MPLAISTSIKVTNEHLACLPGKGAVLLHGLASSAVEEGFQAIIIFDKSVKIPPSLGLPDARDLTHSTCFLQVSPCFQHVVKYCDTPEDRKMAISVQNYLDLYAFFHSYWPKVTSQLLALGNDMRSGTDWVQLSKNLSFLSNGTCNYSATVGKDLTFTASLDSKTAKNCSDFTFVVSISKKDKVLRLPLATVTKLFGDIHGYKHIETMYLTAVQSPHPSV